MILLPSHYLKNLFLLDASYFILKEHPPSHVKLKFTLLNIDRITHIDKRHFDSAEPSAADLIHNQCATADCSDLELRPG